MKSTASINQTDKLFFEDLYTLYYPTVELYVLKNKGSIDDAKDIFQDAIIILLEKLNRDDFVLTASLKTYIVAICKNIWLKHLRDSKSQFNLKIDDFMKDAFFEEIKIFIEDEMTYKDKLTFLMTKITKHCDDLLNKMFFTQNNPTDIQQQFGYSSSHNLQNQKFKCMQQVKKQKEKLEKINSK